MGTEGKTPPHSWLGFPKALNPSGDMEKGSSLGGLVSPQQVPQPHTLTSLHTHTSIPHDKWQLEQLLTWEVNGEAFSLFLAVFNAI